MNFKDGYGQYDEDQIINMIDTMNAQPRNNPKSKPVPVTQQSKPEVKTIVQNIQKQKIQVNSKQQGIIEQYDAQQTILIKDQKQQAQKYTSTGTVIYEQPPILQDIGVDPELVANKMLSILKLQNPSVRYIEQTDLFGPLIIAFLFGLLLMLGGKMHFSDIYFIFVLGNVLLFLLFNLMSRAKDEIITLYNIMSTLGYCLLPMLVLGVLGIVVDLRNQVGILVSLALSAWSAYSASSYVAVMMRIIVDDRTALIFYPLYLYYVSFAMITIF